MRQKKVLYYFNEQLEWLEKNSYSNLKKWILRMLQDNDSYPLFISLDTNFPGSIIQNFFERSSDNNFKLRTKRIIVELVNDWRLNKDPDKLLFELSTMVGYIGIAGARGKLLSLVKEGYLRNRKYLEIDLHFHLLRVLAGLKLSVDLKLVISRDFDSPAYAPILFTSSWLLSEKGYLLAIELLDAFIHLHRKYPQQMEFYPPLRKFLESFGDANLKKYFRKIIDKLSVENIDYFLDSLEKINYLIYPDANYNMVIYVLENPTGKNVGGTPLYDFPPKKSTISIPSALLFPVMSRDKREVFRKIINRKYLIGSNFFQGAGSPRPAEIVPRSSGHAAVRSSKPNRPSYDSSWRNKYMVDNFSFLGRLKSAQPY